MVLYKVESEVAFNLGNLLCLINGCRRQFIVCIKESIVKGEDIASELSSEFCC